MGDHTERVTAWRRAAGARGKPASQYRRDWRGRLMYWPAFNNGESRAWTVLDGEAVSTRTD